MDDKWEFYIDKAGERRWTRRSSSNGEIVGASAEGYKNDIDCINNAKLNGYVKKGEGRTLFLSR